MYFLLKKIHGISHEGVSSDHGGNAFIIASAISQQVQMWSVLF